MDYPPTFQTYNATDDTVNLSSKEFEVPQGAEAILKFIYVKLVTTATVGNRQLSVEILDDSGNVILQCARAGAVQAASLTRYYSFYNGAENMAAFVDTDFLSVNLPQIPILGGQSIKIYDKAAVDAAADDMEVTIGYIARSV